jgi:hypothetical protein
MRQPHYILMTAAEDVRTLRRDDVHRVIETCEPSEIRRTVHYINVNRPDLKDEVESCLSGLKAA